MKRSIALAALLVMAGWTQAQAPTSTAPSGQPMVAPAVAGKPLPHHQKVTGKKAVKKTKLAAHKKSKASKAKKHPKKTGANTGTKASKKTLLAHHHAAKSGKTGKTGGPAAHAASH